MGRREIDNAKWLIAFKTVQAVIQLFVGMLTARYFGPSNYGLINYAKSIVAFAIPFVQLGLDSTLVKELIDHPENEGKIIGTSLILGIVSSLMWVAIISGFVTGLNSTETQTIIVCLLYSFSCVFQTITLIQFWYHSKMQIKISSAIQLICYIVAAGFKVVLLIIKANIYWFAIAYSLEYALTGMALLFIYRRRSKSRLSFSYELAKELLIRSSPYIWASLMVSIFHNTDHIMLKEMVGNYENGYYTAAVTVVGICQYVYVAIVDVTRPIVLEHKKNSDIKYRNSLASLYGIIIYLTLIQGVCFTFFSKYIVYIIYGVEYFESSYIVKILVWMMPFSCMGLIRNIWILSEGKQKYLWRVNLTGVIVNFVGNLMMIPKWGAAGAALTSLLTQFFMNFCLGFIYEPVRENNRIMLMGLHPMYIVETLRNGGIRILRKK